MLHSYISFSDLEFSAQQEIFSQVKEVIKSELEQEAVKSSKTVIELYDLESEEKLDEMLEEMTSDRISKQWSCEATY
jgi:hypothetical protein